MGLGDIVICSFDFAYLQFYVIRVLSDLVPLLPEDALNAGEKGQIRERCGALFDLYVSSRNDPSLGADQDIKRVVPPGTGKTHMFCVQLKYNNVL
jgi:hypothetical protein